MFAIFLKKTMRFKLEGQFIAIEGNICGIVTKVFSFIELMDTIVQPGSAKSSRYARCLLLRQPYTMTTRKQMKGRTNEAFVAG